MAHQFSFHEKVNPSIVVEGICQGHRERKPMNKHAPTRNPDSRLSRAPIPDGATLVGIDCGVKTGFAVGTKGQKSLQRVESMTITQAMSEVLCMKADDLVVLIEDARLRTWFTGGKEKAQGAGSIKRDCSIWEQFCKEQGISYRLIHPAQNNTKLKPDDFKRITGWMGVTNEHARDAAMLVYGR